MASQEVVIKRSDVNRYAQQMRASISGMCACMSEDVDMYETYEDSFQQACKKFLSACRANIYPNPARG